MHVNYNYRIAHIFNIFPIVPPPFINLIIFGRQYNRND